MKKLVLFGILVVGIIACFYIPALAVDGGPSPAPPDEVVLSTTYLELEVGETYRLKADIRPQTARVSYDDIKWRSSDDTVATVTKRPSPERMTSIGLIRTHGPGQAVITVYIDNPLSAECIVVVGPRDPTADPSDPARPIATPPTGSGTLSDSFYLTGFIILIIVFTALTARELGKRTTR